MHREKNILASHGTVVASSHVLCNTTRNKCLFVMIESYGPHPFAGSAFMNANSLLTYEHDGVIRSYVRRGRRGRHHRHGCASGHGRRSAAVHTDSDREESWHGRCFHCGISAVLHCYDGHDVSSRYVNQSPNTTCSTANSSTVRWGMGRHISTLSLHESTQSQKPFYVSIWVYNLAMGCTKYSILLQYLRIFPQKTFRRSVYVMLGINTIYVLWTTLSAIFACWPISYFWTQIGDPTGGRCLNRFAVW